MKTELPVGGIVVAHDGTWGAAQPIPMLTGSGYIWCDAPGTYTLAAYDPARTHCNISDTTTEAADEEFDWVVWELPGTFDYGTSSCTLPAP